MAYGGQPGASYPPPGQAPPPGYQQSPPAYGAPQPGYQQSPPAYGAPQPGYQQSPPAYGTPGYPPQSGGKWGLVAGIMMLIGALIGFGYGAYILYVITMLGAISGGMFFAMGGGWLYVCAILPLLGGIFGLIGGMFALKREKWSLCLVSSILVMLGSWFIFGLLALIFLIIGKDEFRA